MQVGCWLVGFVYERSQESFEGFIVEILLTFLVLFIGLNDYISYIAVIPVLWAASLRYFCWRFMIGHGFMLMWHVVTSPRPHCNPSKVCDKLRLVHDGEVLQCAEQVVCVYGNDTYSLYIDR